MYNPPFNLKVKTRFGKKFLEAITECFKKGTVWAGHFNRHTVKISYSSTSSLATKIAQHNASVINGRKRVHKAGCCCLEKNKAECPIPGDCKAKNVIYRSILTGDGNTYGYIGMTGQTFKQRYYGHQSNFRDNNCRKNSGANKGTVLSAKVWKMKDKGLTPKLEWDIIDWAFPYQTQRHGTCAAWRRCTSCWEQQKGHSLSGLPGVSYSTEEAR